MSESFVFRGNRDQFQEWYDALKIKFNRNGVNCVTFNLATNYKVLSISYLRYIFKGKLPPSVVAEAEKPLGVA